LRDRYHRQWVRRIRMLRRTLKEYRTKAEIDSHLYRKLYLKANGNEFRNKRVLIEHIRTLKVDQEREKTLQEQVEARDHQMPLRMNLKILLLTDLLLFEKSLKIERNLTLTSKLSKTPALKSWLQTAFTPSKQTEQPHLPSGRSVWRT
jgi:hypothetical protein